MAFHRLPKGGWSQGEQARKTKERGRRCPQKWLLRSEFYSEPRQNSKANQDQG